MSIATVVTRGYGSFGSIAEVVTRGYAIGEAVAEIAVDVPGSDGKRRRRLTATFPPEYYVDPVRRALYEKHGSPEMFAGVAKAPRRLDPLERAIRDELMALGVLEAPGASQEMLPEESPPGPAPPDIPLMSDEEAALLLLLAA